ncbi:hypothetical protein KCU73_g10018, partial [Aureobasidium melanogenum]
RKLRKNTRFCRDCGRYLNRPCTWPTCGKCNTKHFEHVPCWQARQNLQNRLDAFDRGYNASQKKKTAKVTALSPTTEPLSQQYKYATKPDTAGLAAPVDLAAPSEMDFNFDENEEISWSLDSNKTIQLGSPPTNSHLPVSAASKSPKDHSHVHPNRQSFFSKPSETAGSIRESLTSIIPTGSTLPSDSRRNEVPHLVTYGASVEENVDAFIAGVFRDMHDNDDVGDAPKHADAPQDVPSYLGYLRRNATTYRLSDDSIFYLRLALPSLVRFLIFGLLLHQQLFIVQDLVSRKNIMTSFHSLPLELRSMVYDYALEQDHDFFADGVPALFKVCPHITKEIYSYRKTITTVCIDTKTPWPLENKDQQWYKITSFNQKQQTKGLVVRFIYLKPCEQQV